MSKDQLRIPTFKSLEEFSIWWKSPEVVQFRQNNPDKIVPLQQHHLIKPWFEQLKVQSAPAVHSSQTQSKTFGKYILEKKLGQGGMGAVYLASDPTLQRQVALKVMTVVGQELIERFNREAQAMAKLKHPNIIQVYEVGTIGKYHYFTMEYIQGPSLEVLINPAHQRVGVGVKDTTNRLSPRQVAEIIRDVASALDYAHKQGIIHRDIKPANIIIDSNNRPYLMDFGLAKELTGLDRSLTMSGTIMGTPDYMSPEQAMGDKKRIDARSDIFSLGATLYHSLSGQAPFRGKELYQVLDQVVHKDPIPPSRLIRGLPKDLETICLKCMDKEKSRRYQTSKALAEDIHRYLEGEPISAKPIGTVTIILKKAKKNKIASFSIVGAAVILLGLIIGLSVSSLNKKQKMEKYRKDAYTEFNKERYEEAMALCNKLLALSPNDKEINTILDKSRKVIKEKEEKTLADKTKAEKETKKVQEEKEIRNKAKGILDRTNVGNPTSDDKIKAAESALNIDPDYGDAYQVMGYAYKNKRDYAKAIECFSKAIEKTSTLAYSYYERAYITAFEYDKIEQSIADFNKVIELDPESHIGYFAKGYIEANQKNYDKAIDNFTKATELKSDHIEAYYNRGLAYYKKSELDKAIEDFNEAIRLNPKLVEAYYTRGIAYEKKGELDKAIEDFNEAIKLNPKYAGAYTNRGHVYADKSELDKAIEDFNETIKLNPKLAEAYYNRGTAYATKGELDKAIEDFNEAIKLNPKDAETYYNRGAAYANKGELDKAIADYNEAIRLNPKYVEAYNNRGTVYGEKGEIDKAIEDFNEAIKLNPKYADAYYNRGSAYAKKGELDKAIADGEMFLKLAPNHPAAKQMRDLIEQWKKALQNK